MSEFDVQHDDYDDVSEENEILENGVQLGFLEKNHNDLFLDFDWNNWDGGKVGGFPVWLDPLSIPTSAQLQCVGCSEPMSFLMQIYCPLDDVEGAFHRCLYWFCCRRKDCFEKSVKCFRNQLPEENDFYPESHDIKVPNLCQLCGCRATSCCSKCKSVHYCSKSHQKAHWKHHKAACVESTTSASNRQKFPAVPTDPAQLNHAFPEYEVLIEEEDAEDVQTKELIKNAKVMESTTIWEDAQTPGGADEAADAAITQSDYNQAMGSEQHDPVYINFLSRIQQGGNDQVLRYRRWALAKASSYVSSNSSRGESANSVEYEGPLLVSSHTDTLKKIKSVPPCERCGAPRAFECQIMPQLLHFLQVDKQTKIVGDYSAVSATAESSTEGAATEIPTVQSASFQNQSQNDFDFGSIDVYTCTKSCSASEGASDAYCCEHVIVQPPPAVYRKVRTLPPAAAAMASGGQEALNTIAEGEETAEG